jgi:hypothetical protein
MMSRTTELRPARQTIGVWFWLLANSILSVDSIGDASGSSTVLIIGVPPFGRHVGSACNTDRCFATPKRWPCRGRVRVLLIV